MIGHDNDVQDLGWANDSSILVSVGLDSKIVVWSGYTFEKLKTITSHQSHVKGITFDPANKYFATASDDRSLQIFRFTSPGPNTTAHDSVGNFAKEKEIREPFVGSPISTYFRRCSWSPDGAHIACANAVNGPVSSVAVIERGSWSGDITLIGHEQPIEVCAFCPRLWSAYPFDNDHPGGLVTVIACAGQDKSVTVWITSNSRPVLISQDMAVKAISDLAWSPDGTRLFVTSLDGKIVALEFKENELGYSASMEENEKALSKFGAGRKAVGLLEGPNNLTLEDKSKEGEMRGVEGRMGALMGDGITVLRNGDASVPSPTEKLTNGVSSELRAVQANGDSGGKVGDATPQPSANEQKDANVATLSAQEAKVERLKQRVTITKDGKKRVAPMLVSSSNLGESALPRAQIHASSLTAQGPANDAPQTILDLSKPYDGLPKGGLASLLLGNKRKLADIEGDEEGIAEKRVALASRDGAVPILQSNANGLALAQPSATSAPTQTPEFIRPSIVNPSLSVSSIRLAVPKLRASITRDIDPNGPHETDAPREEKKEPDFFFEVKNPTGPSLTGRYEDREPARLSVSKKGQPMWTDFLPKSVLLVAGGHQFWAAACEDGSIFAWSSGGRRLFSALALESQPVILEARDSWLLCITAVGLAYVWNIKSLSSPHPPVSIAPILDIATHSLASHPTRAPAVTSAHLNSEGRIIITLSNGDGYTYSPSLYAWQCLSEVWWGLTSQYWNSGDASSVGNLKKARDKEDSAYDSQTSSGILPFLEKHTKNEIFVRGRAYSSQRLIKALLPREGYESFESAVSIAHLENRIAAAMTLGARDEFRSNLEMYAKRLGVEGQKVKAEELLRGLMGDGEDLVNAAGGSLKPGQDDRLWGSSGNTVCGWSRRELLGQLILIFGE